RSVDDTDVGAFVRPLFPIAASNQALPALPERTALEDGALPAAGAPPREPTAVMPSREHASGAKRGASPDEDRHGTTLVLSRDDPAPNGRPPQPTPQMPLQSMGREAPLARRSESREVPAARAESPSDENSMAWAGSADDDAGASESRSVDGGSRSSASARRAESSSRKSDTASARRVALAADERSSADDRELDTVSATEPGPPVAPNRKRALWAGAAVVGLAGLVGVLAVALSLIPI
ncbi:hypothetical protein HRD49_44780, partial [Corallococcus exiguus]|nr:hypothetical protein [Corallococcus exiguus]